MLQELLLKTGWTAEQMLEHLLKKKIISSEVLQSIAEQPKQDDFPQIKVGYYAFDGYLFSPYPDAYLKRQGVVVWVNPDKNAPKGKRGLVMIPKLFAATIASRFSDEKLDDFEDGSANTQKMLARKKYGVSFYGAELLSRYTHNGIQAGQVFIPAIGQLARIAKETNKINRALLNIKAQPLKGVVLSSTEQSVYNMFAYMFGSGQVTTVTKEVNVLIRGVFAV